MFAASKSGKVAAAAAATDPYFPYVPLLLETGSTNGQQNNTFLDSSTNNFTITRNGTPTQGSVTPYRPAGYWSNYLDGSSYLTAPSSVNYVGGAGDFTIEFWFMPTGLTGQGADGSQGIIGGGTSSTGTASSIAIRLGSGTTQATKRWQFWLSGYGSTAVGTSTVSYNTWNHVALVRNGSGTNNCKLYINGSLEVQQTSTYTVPTTYGIYVGRTYNDYVGEYSNGYISNLRILSGTALYTSAFTPPTTPLTAITNTTLLTCQSNRFFDSNTQLSAKTISVGGGTPTAQTFQPFSPTASYTAAAYGGSGYFNGSTDYLSLADNTALQLSTGDFTIEGWFYISGATSTAYNLISKGAAATGWSLNTTTGARIQFSYTASNLTGATTTLVQGAWYHIAVVRSGSASGNLKIYLNGVQEIASAGAVNDDFSQTSTMYVSASRTATLPLNGYSSNVRVVKGTAVYTAAFTPPTAPVTAITNTSLLTNFTNAGIYDAAVQSNAITVGDAQASTTQYKWSPTSMKFDGTGDWLTAIDNPQQQLGTGDFTIDGWVYLSATGVAYGIISKGTASTGWSVNVTSGNKLQFSYTASNLTGATSLAATTWYYFAVVRSGSATGNLKVYLNGTADATSGGAVTDSFTQTNTLYVGADRVGGSALNGYLQDVRITKYARTITTPTAAFPTR